MTIFKYVRKKNYKIMSNKQKKKKTKKKKKTGCEFSAIKNELFDNDKHWVSSFLATSTGNVQNTKPVQKCIYFLFSYISHGRILK